MRKEKKEEEKKKEKGPCLLEAAFSIDSSPLTPPPFSGANSLPLLSPLQDQGGLLFFLFLPFLLLPLLFCSLLLFLSHLFQTRIDWVISTRSLRVVDASGCVDSDDVAFVDAVG